MWRRGLLHHLLLRAQRRRIASAEPEPSASDSTAVPERGDADLVIWTDALKLDSVQQVADTFGEANGISVQVQAIT